MAWFDLMVKPLSLTIHQPEEIFSQVISPSSARCRKLVCRSATDLAASAFYRMAASQISRTLKASPQAASTHLRRTCKAECGPRLLMDWSALKVLNGTTSDHMVVTRQSIPTMFLSIAEEHYGPTQEWGWCFSRKARRISKSQTHSFLKMLISKRLLTALYGWLRRTAPYAPSLPKMGNIGPMALLSM